MPEEVVLEVGSEGDAPPPGAVKVEPKGKSSLDQALETSKGIWGGHPSQNTELVDEDESGGEAAAAAAAADKGKEDEDEDEIGRGPLTQPPKDKGKKPDKPALRGKTHEEEAEIRAEAERWGHDLGKKLKTVEEENKDLKTRLEALEKKGQEESPSPGKKPGEETPGPVAVAKERIRELLVQIDELDQFDPDYYDKKADLMAQLYGTKAQTISEEDLQKLVDKAVKEQRAKDEEAANEEERSQRAAKRVVSMAKKLGLDMREAIGKDDAGNPFNSVDWDLFWDASVRAPSGKDVTLDDQVQWTAREVKRIKGQARAQITKETEEAAAHHRETEILGRHGAGRIPAGEIRKAPAQKLTLQDALQRSQRVV